MCLIKKVYYKTVYVFRVSDIRKQKCYQPVKAVTI